MRKEEALPKPQPEVLLGIKGADPHWAAACDRKTPGSMHQTEHSRHVQRVAAVIATRVVIISRALRLCVGRRSKWPRTEPGPSARPNIGRPSNA